MKTLITIAATLLVALLASLGWHLGTALWWGWP
jgi:hypothetical protein